MWFLGNRSRKAGRQADRQTDRRCIKTLRPIPELADPEPVVSSAGGGQERLASARAGGPLRARWPSAFVGSSPMVRGQRGGGVLKLHFQDHFHNFRESWQVGNESIVQIDCQVIRKVVRPGKSCSCFQLGRNPARCQGRSCARCSGPSPLCS